MLRTALCISFVFALIAAQYCGAESPEATSFNFKCEYDGKVCRASFANIKVVAQNVEMNVGAGSKGIVRFTGQVRIENQEMTASADSVQCDLEKKLFKLTADAGKKISLHNNKTKAAIEGMSITIKPEAQSVTIDGPGKVEIPSY